MCPSSLIKLFVMMVLSIASASFAATKQDYPNKPLRLIVPFPPGGGNDILARTVSQRLSEVIGQQIVVENRGGAGGLIGATTAASAAPDGYTLFHTTRSVISRRLRCLQRLRSFWVSILRSR